MKETTFRRPPIQEVTEKQEGKKEQIKTEEHKEVNRKIKKKLGEYFHPVYGWKSRNKSSSFWDRIRKQRREKRKILNVSKRGNRIDKQKRKNRKRKKHENKSKM